MKNFNELKKQRQDFDKLAATLSESSSNKSGKKEDERFYYPELDKAKNGYAVIRFLPAPQGEDTPYIKRFSHGFKEAGGWYIEECPTTIGDECPVCKANSDLFQSYGGYESTPEGVKAKNRPRNRRTGFVANVYVVSDSKNPENEGQVRLFRFGTKIFEKLMSAVKPKFEDETPIDPFNLWTGANFKLKICKVDGNVNYDSSSFEDSSQLLPTDDELAAVWEKEYSLQAFIGKDVYKSFEENEKRLNQVIGNKSESKTAEELGFDKEDEIPQEKETNVEAKTEEAAPAAEADMDDTMGYFESLAESE